MVILRLSRVPTKVAGTGFLWVTWLALLFLASPHPALAQEGPGRLQGGWRPIPPYQFRLGQEGYHRLTGLDLDLVRAGMTAGGLLPAFEELNWAEQLARVERGELDFVVGATRTAERERFGLFSEPYRTEVDVLYVRRSELYRYDIDEVEDIYRDISQGNLRVAVVEGFYYGPRLHELLRSPSIVTSHSDVENFEALLRGEVDALLIDQLQGDFIAREFGWSTEVAEYPVPLHRTDIAVLFSRATVGPSTVEAFNSGLRAMALSGQRARIFSHYRESRLVSLLLGATGQPWFYALDLLGTFAFAVSGVLLASRARYDIFGAFVLAALPAVGGGVVRDLLVGRHPVGLISHPIYVEIVVATVALAFLGLRRLNQDREETSRVWARVNQLVLFLDAIGLGAFTVIGVLVAAEYRCDPLWLWGPLLAALTGAGGGILRDTLLGRGDCGSLQGELYPEVACLWGLLFSLFLVWYVDLPEYQPSDLLYAVQVCLVGGVMTRLAALKFKVRSPLLRRST